MWFDSEQYIPCKRSAIVSTHVFACATAPSFLRLFVRVQCTWFAYRSIFVPRRWMRPVHQNAALKFVRKICMLAHELARLSSTEFLLSAWNAGTQRRFLGSLRCGKRSAAFTLCTSVQCLNNPAYPASIEIFAVQLWKRPRNCLNNESTLVRALFHFWLYAHWSC